MLTRKKCSLSYAMSKTLFFRRVKSWKFPSLLAHETFLCNGDSFMQNFQESPNVMFMYFLEMGNPILQEFCIMNISRKKKKQVSGGCCQLKVHIMASDVISRSQIHFLDSRNDRNMIVNIIYHQSGGEKLFQ